jgi:copper chaperone CopZ
MWVVLAGAAVVSCRRQDVRGLVLQIPEMKNEACVEWITQRLRNVPGVRGDSIQADRAGRSVTVRYDSLILSRKNIEFAVAEAGFAANGVPAKPEAVAALPAACTAASVPVSAVSSNSGPAPAP